MSLGTENENLHAVERPADVAPVVGADVPLGAVGQLLPAEAQEGVRVGVVGRAEVDERLLEVEVVDVAVAGPALAVVDEARR